MLVTISKLGTDGAGGYIDGRVCQGPLRIGDTFSMMIGHDKRLEDGLWIPMDTGAPVAITLRVSKLTAYARDLDVIEEGLTCRIHLTGSGFELLTEGRLLK